MERKKPTKEGACPRQVGLFPGKSCFSGAGGVAERRQRQGSVERMRPRPPSDQKREVVRQMRHCRTPFSRGAPLGRERPLSGEGLRREVAMTFEACLKTPSPPFWHPGHHRTSAGKARRQGCSWGGVYRSTESARSTMLPHLSSSVPSSCHQYEGVTAGCEANI